MNWKVELKYHIFRGAKSRKLILGKKIYFGSIDRSFSFFKRHHARSILLQSSKLRCKDSSTHSNSFRSRDFPDESREEGILFKIATKNFNKSSRKGDGPIQVSLPLSNLTFHLVQKFSIQNLFLLKFYYINYPFFKQSFVIFEFLQR